MTFADIWTTIGPFVGGPIGLWAFFKVSPAAFIERWFGHYLDRKMAAIKLDNDEKIETIRSGLKHIDDRGVRSNEREYEALRTAWDLFVTAFYSTRRAVAGFRRIPSFRDMTVDEMVRSLELTDFSEAQRQQVIVADDPTKMFSRISASNEINDAETAIAAARDALRRQSVFIPEEINQQFEADIAWLQNAHTERSIQFEYEIPTTDSKIAIELLGSHGETVLNNLRTTVRKRLLRS